VGGDCLFDRYRHRAVILKNPQWRTTSASFYWGDAAVSVLDGVRFRFLVYDPSGASRLAAGRVIHDTVSGENEYTRYLIGNFFIMERFAP
jgi:hypothetical protein